jgi:oxaloacetate decarboxylase alpha subunit
VDGNVLDKISNTAEGKKYLNWEQPQPTIEDLRKEIGRPGISDDELLLRILFPGEHVEATLAAGPIQTQYPRGDKPMMALIQELTARNDYGYIHIQKKGFSLTLQKTQGN